MAVHNIPAEAHKTRAKLESYAATNEKLKK
jgi:hypothetical protein